jgi:hypothetical protein
MKDVIELPRIGKKMIIFYEVSDSQGKAIWGGESVLEAIDWYRKSPPDSKVWVGQYETTEEDAKLVRDFLEITPIVLATIANCVDRFSK